MGNRSDVFYFGAYLEIKVAKTVEGEPRPRFCPLCSGPIQGPYCAKCGQKLQRLPTEMEYPTQICYELLDGEWEDVLNVITPLGLHKTGVILARANLQPGGEWMCICYDDYPEVKPFPTEDEIAAMKLEMVTNYAEIIEAMRQSEHVVSVSVKAGYVLDQEY